MSAFRPIALRWAEPSRLRRAAERNRLGRIHRSFTGLNMWGWGT